MNTDNYVSVLHLYQDLPPLDICLTAAGQMRQDNPSSNAFIKAHEFFIELCASDANIQYDAAGILAAHTLGQSHLPDDVIALLERVKAMKTSAFVRSDDTHVFIRRSASTHEGYYNVSAHECECNGYQYRKEQFSDFICVHIAIVRVIERALIDMTLHSFAKGVPVWQT